MANLLEVSGRGCVYSIGQDSRLRVARDRRAIWASSAKHAPRFTAKDWKGEQRVLMLCDAAKTSVSDYSAGAFRGQTGRLSGYPGVDLAIDLTLALDEGRNELLVEVSQAGGKDTLVSIDHLYRFDKPVSEGGYLVLPHGSGYLIHADCPDELPGNGINGGCVGGRWAMPVFGIVKGNESLAVIVDTWWDSEIKANHVHGDLSEIDFNWASSLGKLAYPRRILLHFEQGMDHVGIAKLYREHAAREGLVRTLADKIGATPQVEQYVEGILFRFGAWNSALIPQVMEQTQKLTDMGMKINFFYPKWPATRCSADKSTAAASHGLWQAFLHPDAVPGWQALSDFADKLKEMGCLIQGFINPMMQDQNAPEFDPDRFALRSDGTREQWWLSTYDAVDRNQRALESLKKHGVHFDVLYYDSYSAHLDMPEDYSSKHPRTRRENYEAQNKCFDDARKAGIMPGGELARFWAMRDCDYWFFTDWSADRLYNTENKGCPAPVGEPVPLFQLVFHDCFVAGFSGGGYGLYAPGYDWWPDRSPRLYELYFVASPSHNWLPEGPFPYDKFDTPQARSRWDWLKKMASLCKATKYSEMVSHKFLSDDRKQQRIKFANGVVMEFDMSADRYRIKGAPGFTGDWEDAPEL